VSFRRVSNVGGSRPTTRGESFTVARERGWLVESDTTYEGESDENRKNCFKFNLLNESGTQLYYFST
jgi:hypothetical protein